MIADPPDDWRTLNRAMWDERTPHHLRSPVYDVDGFRAGRTTLRPHEIADLGDVAGKDLVHLQCHFGLDTLSWARLGARVTGLDFSPSAIAAATALAAEFDLPARFVAADVYDAPHALRATYDIVYTGVGALCWLPDMDRWAAVVRDLLRPGGQLYLFEFHPVEWTLGENGQITDDYFTPRAGYREEGTVIYAAPSNPSAAGMRSVQWNHPLGEVVTALARAGLRIDELRELDRTLVPRWPGCRPTGDGFHTRPEGAPKLPLMYVLRASCP